MPFKIFFTCTHLKNLKLIASIRRHLKSKFLKTAFLTTSCTSSTVSKENFLRILKWIVCFINHPRSHLLDFWHYFSFVGKTKLVGKRETEKQRGREREAERVYRIVENKVSKTNFIWSLIKDLHFRKDCQKNWRRKTKLIKGLNKKGN